MISNFCNMKLMRVLAVMAIFVFVSSQAFAQSTTTGAVYGVVSDSSGAVVPNAKVDVRNVDTNATSSTATDDGGRYRALNLQPGNYEIKVSAPNFANYTATGIVEIGRILTIDPKLNVSGRGETVEVRDEAPVINTERQDFANQINQFAIQNLPSNGRRWSNYALAT